MTSHTRIFLWTTILVIVGAVVAALFVYREQIATFTLSPGTRAKTPQIKVVASVPNDISRKRLSEISAANGESILFEVHYWAPQTTTTVPGKITLAINDSLFDEITPSAGGKINDQNEIQWNIPTAKNNTFGKVTVTAKLSLPPNGQFTNPFDMAGKYCPSTTNCVNGNVRVTALTAPYNPGPLTMEVKTEVVGGGAVKPGKTVRYTLTFKNTSQSPLTLSGGSLFPSQLTPTLAQQPNTGIAYFEGQQFVFDGLVVPLSNAGRPGVQILQVDGIVKSDVLKGEIMSNEFGAVAVNASGAQAALVRRGTIIKGNFILIEIGAQ
jgi:hypothetical protein